MKWKERILPYFSFESIVRRLVASWFWGAFVLLLVRGTAFLTTDFLKDMTWGLPLVLFAAFFVLFSALAIAVRWGGTDSFAMLAGLVACAVAWLFRLKLTVNEGWLFCLAVIVVFAFVLWDFISLHDKGLCALSLSPRISFGAAVAVGVLSALVIGAVTCLRYLNFNSPTYDFGIFAQMYHNMAAFLGPITTCERNEVLSHFAVHLSPIYYVLLPFYWLFPSPLTLQIGQAVVVASGIIPLYLLMRKRGLSPKWRAIFSLLYLLLPSISMGCFFDIHENCFLFPLLLWLFWAYEAEKLPLAALFTVLTCLVKEDSAVYVTIFAIYILFSAKTKKQRLTGLAIMGYALLYFGFAVWYIETFGKGIMSGRYDNVSADGSLVGVIFAAFANPGFFFRAIFARDWESVKYILVLLLPLGFLPAATGKKARWILLIPMLLNLLTDYPYQLELKYQYHFGITAFLLYAAVLNVQELKGKAGKYLVSLALASSFLFYSLYVLPDLGTRVQYYAENKEELHEMEAVVSLIPEDASVNASTFLVPHLSERFYLYDIDYHPEADTDFVLLDMRGGGGEREKRMRKTCEEAGFAVFAETDSILIYVSPDWAGDGEALLAAMEEVAEVKPQPVVSGSIAMLVRLLPADASVSASPEIVHQCSASLETYSIAQNAAANTDFVLIYTADGIDDRETEAVMFCKDSGYFSREMQEAVLYVSPSWQGGADTLFITLDMYGLT